MIWYINILTSILAGADNMHSRVVLRNLAVCRASKTHLKWKHPTAIKLLSRFDFIVQRDCTLKDFTERSEENHQDTFYFCLRLSYFLHPRVEFEVMKVSQLFTID